MTKNFIFRPTQEMNLSTLRFLRFRNGFRHGREALRLPKNYYKLVPRQNDSPKYRWTATKVSNLKRKIQHMTNPTYPSLMGDLEEVKLSSQR